MHKLMNSEISTFIYLFRDYIRLKYQVELIVQPVISAQNNPQTGLFIEENHPKLKEILTELKAFQQDPFNPRYEQASWQTGKPNLLSKQTQTPRQWRKFLLVGKFSFLITALCIVVYILQWIGFENSIFAFFHYPANSQQQAEIWRYVSHSLVHLSFAHILFNLAWWWLFANKIESQMGIFPLLLLYFGGALISGITQNYFSGPAFFGLSGVVYAVLGYVLVQDKYHHQFQLEQGFLSMLILGISLGFISPVFGIQMGNAAHISGLIYGLLVGYGYRPKTT